MAKKLTESLEDYLEAIAELIDRDGHAHTKEIAARLQVKMPSVTAALRQLVEMGYIVYDSRYPVRLTETGRNIARGIVRRHAVLQKFFAEILGEPADKADAIACRLEHVVDEDTVERFVLFAHAIVNRSDARALQIYLTEALDRLGGDGSVLSELAIGERAEVECRGRNLAAAAGDGPEPGTVVTLRGIALDRSRFQVAAGERSWELPREEAENLWVRRIS